VRRHTPRKPISTWNRTRPARSRLGKKGPPLQAGPVWARRGYRWAMRLLAIVALRDGVAVGRERIGVAADAHGLADRGLRRRRAVALGDRLAAERAVLLEDLVGVDRGGACVAALGERVAGRGLMRRRAVALVERRILLAADLDVALVDRVVVERECASRAVLGEGVAERVLRRGRGVGLARESRRGDQGEGGDG